MSEINELLEYLNRPYENIPLLVSPSTEKALDEYYEKNPPKDGFKKPEYKSMPLI